MCSILYSNVNSSPNYECVLVHGGKTLWIKTREQWRLYQPVESKDIVNQNRINTNEFWYSVRGMNTGFLNYPASLYPWNRDLSTATSQESWEIIKYAIFTL